MSRSVRSGAWPGRTPSDPSRPGSTTSSTVVDTTRFSGVTTSSCSVSGSILHLLRFLHPFLDAADEIERLLRQLVVLAVHDLLEAADGVLDRHELPLQAGELLGDEERLRQEALDLAGAGHHQLVVLRQLVDAEDGDDVLQVL